MLVLNDLKKLIKEHTQNHKGVIMNIHITSRKFKTKDSLKETITSKLMSLQKYNDNILDADVTLDFTHFKDSIKTAEIKLNLPRTTLLATESSEDFQKSVNLAVDKLARQLKEVKSKQRSKVK